MAYLMTAMLLFSVVYVCVERRVTKWLRSLISGVPVSVSSHSMCFKTSWQLKRSQERLLWSMLSVSITAHFEPLNTCHIILDHNSHVSWWIFTLLVSMYHSQFLIHSPFQWCNYWPYGGRGAVGIQNCGINFFTQNLTQQFSCGHLLPWLNCAEWSGCSDLLLGLGIARGGLHHKGEWKNLTTVLTV